MTYGKKLREGAKDCWYKAVAKLSIAAAAVLALPGAAYAAPTVDARALAFIQDGMDNIALVCFFLGGGLIGWAFLRIASTMGDGQGAQMSAGMTQIGGGVLSFLVAAMFTALPTLLQ